MRRVYIVSDLEANGEWMDIFKPVGMGLLAKRGMDALRVVEVLASLGVLCSVRCHNGWRRVSGCVRLAREVVPYLLRGGRLLILAGLGVVCLSIV